ncbi:DUF4394 domain-containing protein [Symbioplanes lichenis]|uniref:DUF4394 domain-containing protein n=1 Tax=Symbioplanes lichenis TaxID=1629072 RepID=UPI00273A30D6|nr:DUF4394 domain-containing protein [Actinoplanes lichenis]
MTSRIRRIAATVGALVLTTAGVVAGTAQSSSAGGTGLRAYAIMANGKQLSTFTVDKPDELDWVRNVTGLITDTTLIGLDFRVQDGQLYGVGNKGGIYTISITNAGALTKVSQLAATLTGTNFDIDFNPAANRLRIISDTGQNLRHNLDDGTTVIDPTFTSPPTSGTTTGVTAAAYTNNDLNADTATTLFDLNTTLDQVVIQSPANNGTLAATGALGVDAGPNAGLDIFSTLVNGKTTTATAYAVFVPYGGFNSLYSINLLTGEASLVGEFPLAVSDLALSLTGY